MKQSHKEPLTDLQLMEKIVDLIIDSEYMKELKERYDDWKDSRDPERYWYLGSDGTIGSGIDDGRYFDKRYPEIGNHFKTKAEAKRTMHKLKAWARLKNRGFKVGAVFTNGITRGEIRYTLPEDRVYSVEEENEIRRDLDLLFGGE